MQQPQAKTEPVALAAVPPAPRAETTAATATTPEAKAPSKSRVFIVLGALIVVGLGFGGRMY